MEHGNFITPAIVEVNKINILREEEVFGPVFALIKVENDEEAIKVANDTLFGCGATIISKDKDNAERIAKQLECGSVFVNEANKTDSRVPSGGCKMSGYGRECSSNGSQEFTNIKTIWMN